MTEDASKRMNITARSALQMLVNTSFLPTGVQELDQILGGGLLVGAITEVVGSPGVGKTQLSINCLVYALVHARAAGHNAHVLYFDTELKFEPSRVAEVACAVFPEVFQQ